MSSEQQTQQVQQQTQSSSSSSVKDLTQGEVMWLSTKKGLTGFSVVGVLTYGLSYYLHHNNSFYKNKFAISAKVGLPLMASLFVGSVLFELTMSDAQINPENWIEDKDGNINNNQIKQSKSVPIHHYLMNRIHDRPFYFATVMGLPLAGRILYTRMKEPHLTISQALLQTRVVSLIYLYYINFLILIIFILL